MEFRIADSFTDSLAKLTGDEQKAVKTTAFDLQMDPSGAGRSFHKLDRAKDRNFRSVRVSRDIRLIVHRTASSILLALVGHHDAAYRWAERRRIERHPRTGAAQIVEIRETVREIEVPRPTALEAPAGSAHDGCRRSAGRSGRTWSTAGNPWSERKGSVPTCALPRSEEATMHHVKPFRTLAAGQNPPKTVRIDITPFST